MKRLIRFGACFIIAALFAFTANAQIHLTASLTSAQENPPLATTATGTASITLSDDLSEVDYIITYQGLSGAATGAHFHHGTLGVNGPVVKTLSPPSAASGTFSGSWKTSDATQPLTAALIDSLLTGRLYVNFHTSTNPGGELRGQVNLATSLHFTANLSAANEVSSNSSTGTGTGVFVLSPDRTQLQYSLSYRGLTGAATGGHIHIGATGINGGVVKGFTLPPSSTLGTINGVWKASDASQPLTPALVDSLISGHTYSNLHTATNPGGEIRGQLTLNGGIGFLATLDQSQENPPTGATGTGTGSFLLNATRTQLSWAITYINMSGPLTGGHFHVAGSGRNGPVVKSIASSGDSASSTISGVWTSGDATNPLTPALVDSILTGRAYVNYHTSSHPGGEIRGQLNMTTGLGFTAKLNGQQEPANIVTTATGTGSIVLSPDHSSLHYDVTYTGLSGTITGGHFHVAPAGVSGPVVKPIGTSGAPASASVIGDWTSSDATNALTPTLVDSMIAGKLYVNFHTAANPGGEIRGQVSFEANPLASVDEPSAAVGPTRFALEQNYPNPFNPSTNVSLRIGEFGLVKLVVYDVIGREVATLLNEVKAPGTYTVRFDGTGLASGVYFARLQSGARTAVTKMILMK